MPSPRMEREYPLSGLVRMADAPGYAARDSAALLRWLVQQDDVVALSRTTNPERIVENLAVFDFELREDEMAAIQTLARPNSRIVNPAGLAPVWDAS